MIGLFTSRLEELQGCWATANMRTLDLGVLKIRAINCPIQPKMKTFIRVFTWARTASPSYRYEAMNVAGEGSTQLLWVALNKESPLMITMCFYCISHKAHASPA